MALGVRPIVKPDTQKAAYFCKWLLQIDFDIFSVQNAHIHTHIHTYKHIALNRESNSNNKSKYKINKQIRVQNAFSTFPKA